MKFTWFHLMPWPHMPDDFRQKHRSVWVDLPNKMYEPELGHIAYHLPDAALAFVGDALFALGCGRMSDMGGDGGHFLFSDHPLE